MLQRLSMKLELNKLRTDYDQVKIYIHQKNRFNGK